MEIRSIADKTDSTLEIIDLYVDCFSTGISEQHIDIEELKIYIDKIIETGIHLIAMEDEKLAGAILCCPLLFDTLFPKKIRAKFPVEKCLYIAELMVNSKFRGKGLGKTLLNKALESSDTSTYSDVFIRVWDKNQTALQLYKKAGFEEIDYITQQKTKANSTETFEMTKIYLHKKLHK